MWRQHIVFQLLSFIYHWIKYFLLFILILLVGIFNITKNWSILCLNYPKSNLIILPEKQLNESQLIKMWERIWIRRETKSCACNAFNEWECEVKYSAIIWRNQTGSNVNAEKWLFDCLIIADGYSEEAPRKHLFEVTSCVISSHLELVVSVRLFSFLNVGIGIGTCVETKIKHKAKTKGQARPHIGTFDSGDWNLQEPFWSNRTWLRSSIFDVCIQPTQSFGAITLLAIFQQYYRWRQLMICRLILYLEVGP